jgi:glucose-6-phosphate 1-dehydrogenase
MGEETAVVRLAGLAGPQGSVPRPDNHVIVMRGATGELVRRNLLPGLFHLAAAGLMPGRYKITGSSR